MPVFQLNHRILFPPPNLAREDGLLAVGGDLSPQRLLAAYRLGIFPWFSEEDPILWWSPSPRLVLFPEELHLSRRLQRKLRTHPFQITFDRNFPEIIEACATTPRAVGPGTWIDRRMITAYTELFRLGFAHSVECWQDGRLAGGLYGVALGAVFFGESMFSLVPDSSKAALVALVGRLHERGYRLLDCQVPTNHLQRMGAREIDGEDFFDLLQTWGSLPARRW